ncbi:hypothetical protein NONO_c09790 [Nocardia nova SH22a]|uniref:Lipoprotein n=1 Tax=Nocardia nova SH22a TaxID=1415166 RepID=W5TEW1_9NOCA|nr:hypothetical protein [Nocardia nova]AHH15786.1 hypothetical protein NONO_c09790 [Nocardia nova SH22a]
MTTRITRMAVAVLSLCALASATGCGSTVGGWAGPSEIDVRTLDIGSYQTEPLDIHVDYRPGFTYAPQAAGMRLAENVVTADQVDPKLTMRGDSYTFTSGVMPESVGDDQPMSDAAKRNSMVYGFTTTGRDKNADWGFSGWPKPDQPNATILSLTVMQFNDPDAATRAATDFYNTDFNAYKDRNQPVTIAKYPDAHAHWQPGTPSIRSFLAHGPYVVSVLALTPSPDIDGLTGLTVRALDTEFPLLDKLKPITDEETVTLPWDPDYLLSRALNTGGSGRPQYGDDNGVFGPHAILHYMADRKLATQSVSAVKANEFAKTSDALVVRTADAASAKKAVTDRITFQGGGPAVDPVPQVPDSSCVENTSKSSKMGDPKRYICIVAYRNYIGYVTSSQLVDVHQRAAAQYALFANSQWQP